MILVHHAERCPSNEKLLAFVTWWATHGPFPIVLTHGDRTDEEQLALYELGRARPGKVVTHAKRAADSAHGHRSGMDAQPVRALYPNGAPKLVYLGDETDDEVRAEALRLLNIFADLVKEHGLESGRDFPGLHDLPHAQDPAWKSRPLSKGVAP